MSQEKETPHQVTYDRGHFHCSKQIDKTKIVSIRNICVKYYPFIMVRIYVNEYDLV